MPSSCCIVCVCTHINILSLPFVLGREKSEQQSAIQGQSDRLKPTSYVSLRSQHQHLHSGSATFHSPLAEGIYFIKNISFTWRSCQLTNKWEEKKLRVFFVCQKISQLRKCYFSNRGKEERNELGYSPCEVWQHFCFLQDLPLVFETSLLIKNKLCTKNKQFGFLKKSLFKDTGSLLFENNFITTTLIFFFN